MLSEEKIRDMLVIRQKRLDKVKDIGGMPHLYHGLLHEIEILKEILEEKGEDVVRI